MATDPDRQSNGLAARQRRRALSGLRVRVHTTAQILWLSAVAIPVAAKVSELAHRPSAHVALSIVAISGIWALVAGCAWSLRVLALTGCGRWGDLPRLATDRFGAVLDFTLLGGRFFVAALTRSRTSDLAFAPQLYM